MNTKVTVVGVRQSRSGITGVGCGMARGVLVLLLMCTGCTAEGEGYSDYNLVNMPHYDYDPPSAPRAPFVPEDIDDVDYPDPSSPHLDYKFDDEPHEKKDKALNGWSQEIRKSKNPIRPVSIEQHVDRYDLENEVLKEKVDTPNRRRKSRLNRRQRERVTELRRRPSFRSRHDDIEDEEIDDVSYSNRKSHDDIDIEEERVHSRRPAGSLLRRKPRARSMDDEDMMYSIKTFEAEMTRTSPIDDEYPVDPRDVKLIRKVTDALDQIEDLKRLYAINKKKTTTTEDAMMDPKIRGRLQRPERTTVVDRMARWWAQRRAELMKDLLPGVENNNRPPNYQPEDLNISKPILEEEGSELRDDLELWSGRRAALMKKLVPQLKDAKTELPKSTTDIEVGPIPDSDDNERDVWTGLKRNKLVEQVMRKLIMDKGKLPSSIQTPRTTISEDNWWAHRRAGILNKINRPEMKRLTTKKSTKMTTTKRKITTTKSTTTTTTTRTTVYVFPELEMTQAKPNVSEELSYEEKSRLSILKKALRKENQCQGTTRKPPVLMVVTQQMNTVVMVGPLGAELKRRSMHVVTDDSPQRLALVKRLMREKLVKNAKNIHELVDDWDREVCDYVDMSLLSADRYSTSVRVHHSFLASTIGIVFVLVF